MSPYLSKLLKNIQIGIIRSLEEVFLEQFWIVRTSFSLLVGILGIFVFHIAHELTGHYDPSIVVASAVVISLFSVFYTGIMIIIIIALLADYFYIPPARAVLQIVKL